jgi:hypothetical protein
LKVFAWRNPNYSLERASEMTLIHESCVNSYTGYAAAFKKKFPRLFYSRLDKVFMRRNPGIPEKETLEMERAQTCHSRQIFQREVLRKMRLDELTHAINRIVSRTRLTRGWRQIPVAQDQAGEHRN